MCSVYIFVFAFTLLESTIKMFSLAIRKEPRKCFLYTKLGTSAADDCMDTKLCLMQTGRSHRADYPEIVGSFLYDTTIRLYCKRRLQRCWLRSHATIFKGIERKRGRKMVKLCWFQQIMCKRLSAFTRDPVKKQKVRL